MSSDTPTTPGPIAVLNHIPLQAHVRVQFWNELRQQLVNHNTPDVSVELSECTYIIRWPDGSGLPTGELKEATRVLLRHLETDGHTIVGHDVYNAPRGMAAPLTPALVGPPVVTQPIPTAPVVAQPVPTAPVVRPQPPQVGPPIFPPQAQPPALTTQPLVSTLPVQQELAGLTSTPIDNAGIPPLTTEAPTAPPLVRRGARWTEEELALLALTPDGPYPPIAAQLGRTVAAVSVQASKVRVEKLAAAKAKG